MKFELFSTQTNSLILTANDKIITEISSAEIDRRILGNIVRYNACRKV
jgi:hypothetical protein